MGASRDGLAARQRHGGGFRWPPTPPQSALSLAPWEMALGLAGQRREVAPETLQGLAPLPPRRAVALAGAGPAAGEAFRLTSARQRRAAVGAGGAVGGHGLCASLGVAKTGRPPPRSMLPPARRPASPAHAADRLPCRPQARTAWRMPALPPGPDARRPREPRR